eukprot:scaffold8649_cov185-Amphora_coffeaeformis.AAC.12
MNPSSRTSIITSRRQPPNGFYESARRRRRHDEDVTTQKMMRRHHRAPFNLRLWISSKWDEIQASLFFAPCLGVVLAIGVALCCVLLDKHYWNDSTTVPSILQTTVDSARSILGTIAGATISIAGTAFSISLLVFQMTSTTFSPRITHTLFRDPFNRRVMAFNVAVFTYCLVVLRSVRMAGDEIIIPNISVALAVLLGIGSILSIVAFIDHAAHSLDVSELLHRVCKDTIFMIQRDWPLSNAQDDDKDTEETSKHGHKHNAGRRGGEEEEPHNVRFRESGWVQELHLASLEGLVPKDGYIKILTAPGRYVLRGSPLCEVYCGDKDMTDEEWYELDTLILDHVATGRIRTMRDDPAFGLRQIVDVSLKALSPGVNDPTTAQDSIFHAADVVLECLLRDPPPSVIKCKDHDGVLILDKQHTYDDIVKLAYNEVRVCAATSPTVCLYLMESLHLIRETLTAFGFADRAPEIERQVQLIEANCRQVSSHISADLECVALGRSDRFPSLFPTGETTYKDIVKNTKDSSGS